MHILPMNKVSGAEKMALLMCTNFKNYEPIVLCGGEILKKVFEENKIKSYSLSFSQKHIIKTIFNMKKIIKENNIEILHCHDNTASLYGYLVKRVFGLDIKVISHIHNCYPFLKGNGINKKVDKLIRNKYDYNIACGKKVYDFYDKYTDYFDKDKVEILSNAMDIEKITKVDKKDVDKTIKEFNIPKDKKILGFIGRLSEQKGIIPFIKEFKKYKDKFNDSIILLVGDGDQSQQVKNLLKELDIEKYFILTGFQDNVYKFYPILDVMFLPSLYEGLPMVLLEAMAFKKPIVAMDAGSINEIINKGRGELITLGDYKSFIEKLADLKNDLDKQKIYGIKEFNFLRKNYDINKYIDKIDKIYKLT